VLDLKDCGRVAQVVEQCPFKAWVAGSNPAALTSFTLYSCWFPRFPSQTSTLAVFDCARFCAGLSPEYQSFRAAKHRCRSPKYIGWKNYGGRGTQFRFESFEQFFAELGPRPLGTTLDRIDTNGRYEPGNVRWRRGVNRTVTNVRATRLRVACLSSRQ
jgi:hypothetical protein